jgi:hypothetical protein
MVDSCVISSCVLIIGNCWCAVPARGDPLARGRGRDIPETPRSSREGPTGSPAGRGTSTCLLSHRQSICCSWRGRQRIISHLTVQHGARQVRCAAEVTLLRAMGRATTRTARTAGARCDTSRPVERKDGPGRPRPEGRPSPATADRTANSASSDNPGPESWKEKPLSNHKCSQQLLPGSRSKRSSSALPTQAFELSWARASQVTLAPFSFSSARATTASRQPPVWDLGDAHVCPLP